MNGQSPKSPTNMSTEIGILLEMSKETNESLSRLRQTSHDIINELHGIQGQMTILRNDFKNEQQRSGEAFQSITTTLAAQEKELRSIENKVITLEKDVETVQQNQKSAEDFRKKVMWTVLSFVILGVLGTVFSIGK